MSTTQISITLENQTLDKINKTKGLVPRSKYIDFLLSKALELHERESSKETDKSFDHANGGKP